jgi:hypothetical protein
MTDKPPSVGFWSALGALPPKTYAVELLVTLVVGIPGACYVLSTTSASDRHEIAYDYLFVAAPLLGLVFAAFVLVVSLFSDSYVRTLAAETQSGIAGFLRPFVVAIGLQLFVVLASVGYRAVSDVAPSKVEVVLFVTCTIAFLFAVFDVLAVTRTVAKHGITRALAIEVEMLEEEDGRAAKPVPLRSHRR